MFTVKHITWNGGFETIYQAKEVRTKRSEPQCSTSYGPIECVSFDSPNGDAHSLSDGTVYVMNDAGRTVAKYEIASPLQQAMSAASYSVTTGPDGAATISRAA